MLIQDTAKQNRQPALLYMMLVLAVLLIAILWSSLSKPTIRHQYSQLPASTIHCGAEEVQQEKFFKDGIEFGNSNTQSDEAAHSGNFSCKLPEAKEAVYGFGYQLENPKPGKSYRASVWRKRMHLPAGYLVVSIEGEDGQYIQENQARVKDSLAWEQLSIRFTIPYQKDISHFRVYVYSQGHTEVFFDDLLIEELSTDSTDNFSKEHLQLEIPPSSMEQLEQKRETALKAGLLETNDNDWVPATIIQDKNEIAVELRLKGDWLDHLQGDKWSFRIKVKGENTWHRMRAFSLHTPIARHFLSEWLLHRFFDKEDVLTTRYDFVELSINGQSLGVYAYEEHFEKQLLEYRQRREGPILKLSEAPYWQSIKRQLAHHGFTAPAAQKDASDDWREADIAAFKEKTISENEVLSRQYNEAYRLLSQYQQGLADAGDVFDLELMARYYAICDITNAYHGIIWHNQRFYYNPVSGFLEPIGFDGFGGPPGKKYSLLGAGALNKEVDIEEQLFGSLFADSSFVALYIKEVQRLSTNNYITSLLDELYPSWSARLSFIQNEFESYRPNYNALLTEAQYIQSLIMPIGAFSLSANKTKEHDEIRLENRHPLPIEIIGYGFTSQKMTSKFDSVITMPGSIERKLLARLKRDGHIAHFNQIKFMEEGALKEQAPPIYLTTKIVPNAHYLFFRTLGTDSLFSTPIRLLPNKVDLTEAQVLRKKAKVQENSHYQLIGTKVIFPKGKHILEQDIIIPAGYTLTLSPGTQIITNKGVRLITYSPIKAYGTDEEPIKVSSEDGTAGGFTVLQAAGTSELKNVHFDNLNTLKVGNWQLTGAVTFYESDVKLYRCSFTNSQCEDALNIIRSNFEMNNCLVKHTASDGFDADFCKGTIVNSHFKNTTNDGIDCSGSIININQCYLEQNGDKGISVGEESDVTLFNTSITGAPIGVASKDLSVLFVRDLQLTDCKQGFVAFQKKPEYGGGKIVVESYKAQNVKRLYAISKGSTLQLEQELIE